MINYVYIYRMIKELVTQDEQIELGNGGVATISNPGDIEPLVDNYIIEVEQTA